MILSSLFWVHDMIKPDRNFLPCFSLFLSNKMWDHAVCVRACVLERTYTRSGSHRQSGSGVCANIFDFSEPTKNSPNCSPAAQAALGHASDCSPFAGIYFGFSAKSPLGSNKRDRRCPNVKRAATEKVCLVRSRTGRVLQRKKQTKNLGSASRPAAAGGSSL